MPTHSLRTYSLVELLKVVTGQVVGNNTFHLGHFTGNSRLLAYPLRLQGYAIGVPTSGWLRGTLNLEPFQVSPGQLMIIAPHQIHSIQSCSADFAMRTLFFTDSFLAEILREPAQLTTLSFFQPQAPAVLQTREQEWRRINSLVTVIEQYYWPLKEAFQNPVRYLLQAILTDLDPIYTQESGKKQPLSSKNRPLELANKFRQLVSQQYLTKQKIAEYADELAVSSKHLSETIKQVTGRPASKWIDEMLLLEGQVLLRQTNLSVAQIAERLNFSSQSAFSKFFHSQSGQSPVSFRRKPYPAGEPEE